MVSLYTPNNRFTQSSKNNPCPVCGRTKDGDCRTSTDGNLVLCHRNFNHEQTPQANLNLWHYLGESSDGRCGKFVLKTESDRTEKAIRPKKRREFYYPARDGSPLARVVRIDDGKGNKKIWQERWDGKRWVKGLDGIDRADVPVYRYADIRQAIAQNQLIIIAEGEPAVDLLWSLGLAATCNIGGAEKWQPSDTSDLSGASVAVAPDRDEPGIKHSELLDREFPGAQWLYPYPGSAAWDNLPKSGGLDIADWIADKKLDAENLLNFLTPHPRTRKNVVCQKYDSSTENYIPDTALAPDQNFVQKAEAALYSGAHWVTVGGQFYLFDGAYYELQSEAQEKRRIGDFLSTHVEKVNNRYAYHRAKSSNVTEILNWVAIRKGVDPKDINPDGLNCSNGVVKINPDGSHTFTPHNPDRVYTYVGCKYDPDADPTDCDRLLECLTPLHREVFLRTAAAALAVKLVRKKIGRKLKGLLCFGDGNNGKDTLRAAMAAVLGRGMTGKTLSDFRDYDKGRKFNLAGIEEALCNWSSENASTVKLDALQSLKQFITGDPLDIERKGKDSFPCNPSAIFLANCNKLPSITGGMEAITSRYSIIKFEKTFVVGADPSKGEVEADPRLKDDPDFIRDRIAPALLNMMLERLPLVLKEGIDHSVTEDAMREAQEESRHLWGFVREMGIEAQPNGRIYIKDLWEQLQRWYVDTGVLDIERNGDKEKLVWNDLPNEWDKPVKAVNQVYARLCELFPKIQKHRYNERDDMSRKGQWYLSGIGFMQNFQTSTKTASPASPVDTERVAAPPLASPQNTGEASGEASGEAKTLAQSGGEASGEAKTLAQSGGEASGEASGEAKTLAQSGGEAGEAIYSPVAEICKLLSQLTDDERQKLAEILTQPQPKPEQLAAPIASDTVQNHHPLPEPETVEPRDIKIGDRVEIVGSDIKHYNGVTGKVVDVWVKANNWGYMVDFDKPINNANFCDFPDYEVRKLHDSDG